MLGVLRTSNSFHLRPSRRRVSSTCRCQDSYPPRERVLPGFLPYIYPPLTSIHLLLLDTYNFIHYPYKHTLKTLHSFDHLHLFTSRLYTVSIIKTPPHTLYELSTSRHIHQPHPADPPTRLPLTTLTRSHRPSPTLSTRSTLHDLDRFTALSSHLYQPRQDTHLLFTKFTPSRTSLLTRRTRSALTHYIFSAIFTHSHLPPPRPSSGDVCAVILFSSPST